ncbi:hypothetical protein J3F83DRAFT_716618 [Trichoderma novae-zelandiae]
MCVHFQSWNRCSSCFLTFNRRRNRVPCWNGAVSRWRVHRHGLSCRSGWYERADDEVYTHLFCEACSHEEAANLDVHANRHDAAAAAAAAAADDDDDDNNDHGGKGEGRGGGRRGRRRVEDEATAMTMDVALAGDIAVTKKRVRSLHGVFRRLFSLRQVVRVRKTSKGKRHFRVRIWML